jgi:hypothetical protein
MLAGLHQHFDRDPGDQVAFTDRVRLVDGVETIEDDPGGGGAEEVGAEDGEVVFTARRERLGRDARNIRRCHRREKTQHAHKNCFFGPHARQYDLKPPAVHLSNDKLDHE